MTEQTNTPTPPFTAYVNGREWGSTQIVRETTTQWVSENGERWRKKDGKLIGDSDRWFSRKIIIPGDDAYEYGRQEFRKKWLKSLVSRHLQGASEWRGTYEERANHARLAAEALDALRDMEVGA